MSKNVCLYMCVYGSCFILSRFCRKCAQTICLYDALPYFIGFLFKNDMLHKTVVYSQLFFFLNIFFAMDYNKICFTWEFFMNFINYIHVRPKNGCFVNCLRAFDGGFHASHSHNIIFVWIYFNRKKYVVWSWSTWVFSYAQFRF